MASKAEAAWRELEPTPTRARKCSGCAQWVRYPDWMVACGKGSGHMGVRLCRQCATSPWELSTPADDSPNLRKCRSCGQRKRFTVRIDGWNSICGACLDAASKEVNQWVK